MELLKLAHINTEPLIETVFYIFINQTIHKDDKKYT